MTRKQLVESAITKIVKKVINEGSIKVSSSYWNSLTKQEQQFIIDRYDIDGLQALKTLISSARKQLPNYDKIYGKGFVEKDGQLYLWTGWDTKKFKKVDR